MDTVWVDTMFPGLDPDEGWEENMKRVVNYDYLLKEYLDWQLKHLTTDNFDPTDWANVTADIISMAAGSVDLTAYYDKSEVDAKAQLILDTADDHADAKLLSYYTKDEADAQAQLTLETAEGYTNTALGSYYTKTEIGDFTGYQSAVAALQAYADDAVASIDLSAYYSKTDVDGMFTTSEASIKGYADGLISGLSLTATGSGNTARLALMSGQTELGNGASLALSVTNNSNGYSTLALTAGGVTLATSGQINLGGDVIFSSTNIGSSAYRNSNIRSGVASIIDGVVTANYVNALGITANDIVANATITSPRIDGGLIVGSTFYSPSSDTQFLINASGWTLYQKSGSSWPEKASLEADSTSATLTLGNTIPVVLEKYYSNSTHYLWLGNSNRTHGLLINLSTGAYSFS